MEPLVTPKTTLLAGPFHAPETLYIIRESDFEITPLLLPELQHLSCVSFCQFSLTSYFLYGGYDRNTGKPVNTAYILETETQTLTQVASAPLSSCSANLIRFKNLIYVVSGREKPDVYTFSNTMQIYNISDNTWARGPDIPAKVKGIVRLMAYENKLIIFLYRSSLITYTIDAPPSPDNTFNPKAWSKETQFGYDYDHIFANSFGESILTNSYQRTICGYNPITDTLVLRKVMPENYEYDHVFAIRGNNWIVFMGREGCSPRYLIYDIDADKFRFVAEIVEGKISQHPEGLTCSTCTQIQPMALWKTVGKTSPHLASDESMLMFGTNYFPFRAGFSIKEDNVEVDISPIPRGLRLANEQGVKHLTNETLVFAGGYCDDRSRQGMAECTEYNITTSEVTDFPDCIQPAESTFLKAVRLGNWGRNGLVYKNIDENLEIYAPKNGTWEWTEASPLDTDGESTYILDEFEQLLVFFTKSSGDGQGKILSLHRYDLHTSQWHDLGQSPISDVFFGEWNHKIEENKYLILELKDKKWWLVIMELNMDPQGKLSKVSFQTLSEIPNSNARPLRFQTWIMKDTFCLAWVKEDWNIGYFFFNIKDRTCETRPVFKALAEAIDDVLTRLGFNGAKSHLSSFAIVDWLRVPNSNPNIPK